MGRKIMDIMSVLIVEYVITIALLLLLALLSYRGGFKENVVKIGIYIIYGFVNFIAGIFIGKRLKRRRVIYGALQGLLYIVVLLLVSIVSGHGLPESLLAAAICIIAGIAGGFLSPVGV